MKIKIIKEDKVPIEDKEEEAQPEEQETDVPAQQVRVPAGNIRGHPPGEPDPTA